MNINCIICSDLFSPTTEIYSTTCGHVFHYTCLIQWIERSRTCPQCRNKVTEKTIHRVYFNFSNTEGIVEDVGSLQNKLDNLQFQIKVKDRDFKVCNDKYKQVKNQNLGLREEIKKLSERGRATESAIHALKEQVQYFKQKSKENDKLDEELIRLKMQLRNLENVQKVLSGSREQVNDLLRHNRDPQSLTILVTTLKKELMEADKKKKQLSMSLKQSQNDLTFLHQQLEVLTKENSSLQQEVEVHKSCEKDRKYLKMKITELQAEVANSAKSPNVSVRRIISESPAPFLQKANLNTTVHDINLAKTESPSLLEKVQHILDTDSPYLPVKSSSVGLSSLVHTKFTTFSGINVNKGSLFKQPATKIENVKGSKQQEYSYDGLGGHSKEDKYPSPILNCKGLKRTKSSSTVTSTKFRKLAPNKKLKEFFLSEQTDT